MQNIVDFTWPPESMQAELTGLSARLGSPALDHRLVWQALHGSGEIPLAE
jgi:hypothetical protein